MKRSFVCGWKMSSTGVREYFMMDYTGERVKILCFKIGDSNITTRSDGLSYINYDYRLLDEMVIVFHDYLVENGCLLSLATA